MSTDKKLDIPLYDCHSHTHRSLDSTAALQDMLDAAVACGLSGYTVTDHCDMDFCREQDVVAPIIASVGEAHAMRDAYAGRLHILAGVELGELHWNRTLSARVTAIPELDVVIGSVHAVRYKDYTMPYSRIDFSLFSDAMLEEFMWSYFSDMREMLEGADIDILAHLTCPLRYIVGQYKRPLDLTPYRKEIEEILKTVIVRDIALEVNASGIGRALDRFMPDPDILALYRSLGGRRITLASDAHTPEGVANGFPALCRMLTGAGFREACYFEGRRPVSYPLI